MWHPKVTHSRLLLIPEGHSANPVLTYESIHQLDLDATLVVLAI